MGRVDWALLLDPLRAAGYEGVMSIEYEGHFLGFDPDTEEGILAGKGFRETYCGGPAGAPALGERSGS